MAVGGCWCSPDGQPQAFYAALTPEQQAWPAISSKELLALVLWIEHFGAQHRGALVLFGTDNAGNVFSVNKLRTNPEDPVSGSLLSRLLTAADANSIECLVWWCPRVLNGIADDLSKCDSSDVACRIAGGLGLQFHGISAASPEAVPPT